MTPRRTLIALVLILATAPPGRADVPKEPYEEFRIRTDSVPAADIAGWILPARHAKGTIFLCHGYGTSKEYLVGWQWIREAGWNVVMFDFREHGQSTRTRHLSTLGYYEIWDLKAVIDHAESKGLQQPFCIYGGSMGAAIALRWASQDPRVTGVLASSSFVNAYDASRMLLRVRSHVPWLETPFAFTPGFAAMIKAVDIPAAVSQRDDLVVWLIAGEHDWFPPSDQQKIYDASASPGELKRLLIAPGRGHNDTFLWKGNASLPSHDDYIRQFLSKCLERHSRRAAGLEGTMLVIAVTVGIVAAVAALLRVRRSVTQQTASQPRV